MHIIIALRSKLARSLYVVLVRLRIQQATLLVLAIQAARYLLKVSFLLNYTPSYRSTGYSPLLAATIGLIISYSSTTHRGAQFPRQRVRYIILSFLGVKATLLATLYQLISLISLASQLTLSSSKCNAQYIVILLAQLKRYIILILSSLARYKINSTSNSREPQGVLYTT